MIHLGLDKGLPHTYVWPMRPTQGSIKKPEACRTNSDNKMHGKT